MTGGPEIRSYRVADEAAVAALWREVFPEAPPSNDPVLDIGRKLEVQPDLFLVARVGDELVGTTMAGYDGHRGWLYYVAVSPRWRRRGLGRLLVAAAERALAARGCPKVNLQVRSGNRRAEAFWERLGYGREERVSFGKRLPE